MGPTDPTSLEDRLLDSSNPDPTFPILLAVQPAAIRWLRVGRRRSSARQRVVARFAQAVSHDP